MASSKSKAASRKTTSTRSRSAAKTSSARSRAAATPQTSLTAGDNEPGANLVNEEANRKAAEAAATARDEAIKAQTAADEESRKPLDPKVAALIFDTSEPQTSLNSLPKDEGGLPADVISGLRAEIDQHRGAAALGQPGQKGHGVGTAFDDTPRTDEERAANEEEYRKRFG